MLVQDVNRDLGGLWRKIKAKLDAWPKKNWRQRITEFGQLDAVERRSRGGRWSDDEVFEAVLKSVLSANTVWSKIEAVDGELADLFSGFKLAEFARLSDVDIDGRFVPWFKERTAGSMALRRRLVDLIGAAERLLEHSRRHGSADDYFTSVMNRCLGDPKDAALVIGSPGRFKLPSLGVPLAAEALRNLGYDVAKPDRHINRAVGVFGLVHFHGWDPVQEKSPKGVPPTKQREVMDAVERLATAAGERVVLVDNAIWLLCAKDEVGLSNIELAELAE